MVVELETQDDIRSDGRLPSDLWTRWITSQDHHFDRTSTTLNIIDIPMTIFVGFCLYQIFKNL